MEVCFPRGVPPGNTYPFAVSNTIRSLIHGHMTDCSQLKNPWAEFSKVEYLSVFFSTKEWRMESISTTSFPCVSCKNELNEHSKYLRIGGTKWLKDVELQKSVYCILSGLGLTLTCGDKLCYMCANNLKKVWQKLKIIVLTHVKYPQSKIFYETFWKLCWHYECVFLSSSCLRLRNHTIYFERPNPKPRTPPGCSMSVPFNFADPQLEIYEVIYCVYCIYLAWQ